jgi:hypothetical protein
MWHLCEDCCARECDIDDIVNLTVNVCVNMHAKVDFVAVSVCS